MINGVYPNTPAFTIGNDANGNPIMELVDAAGNLKAWVTNPAGTSIIGSIYTPGPAAVNEKRLIGMDLSGNPVFQQIDGGGNLVQFTENQGQTGFIVAPFYVSVDGVPLQAGNQASGSPQTNFPSQVPATTGNAGAAATAAGAQNGTGSGPAVSPFYDPTHRSIGWGLDGKEKFIQIDQAGEIVTYESDGTGLSYLGPATMNAVSTAAALLAANPYKTNPLLNPPAGTIPLPVLFTAPQSNTLVYLGLAAAAAFLFTR